MKDEIRTNLDMIYDNIGNFNDYSLQYIDKKKLRKFISIWRWYISHGYFNDKHPQLEGIASNPPLTWLHSQLQGQSVPLSRDIGRCIEPIVSSSIMTEGSARRIMDRLNRIYDYVTLESAKADQEAMWKKNIVEPMKAAEHAKYEKARRDKKVEEERQKKFQSPEWMKKVGDAYNKKQKKQREMFKIEEEERKKLAQKEGRKIRRQMTEDKKKRRREMYGNKT